MRAILLLLLATSAACAAENELRAQGLRASSFSEDGRLIRQFSAESASGLFTVPVVEYGKVKFFDKSAVSTVVALVEWDKAQYTRSEEVIVGDGSIRLTTDEGIVSGLGFRCGLETGRLDLQSNVKFTSESLRLTGDQASIDFETKGPTRNDVIRHIAVTGNIVLEREATDDAPFDRAENTFARFNAAENKLFLKTPIVVWRKGEKSTIDVASGFFEIQLKKKQPNPTQQDAEDRPVPNDPPASLTPSASAARG